MFLEARPRLEGGAKNRVANEPTHVTQGSVLDELGFSPGSAAVLKFKAALYHAILMVAGNYPKMELRRILGEPQARVTELLNGKIANKSVDELLGCAGRLEIEVETKFAQSHAVKGERDLTTNAEATSSVLRPLIQRKSPASQVRSRCAPLRRIPTT
jgi:predicted XRE-type DNA-binding protein